MRMRWAMGALLLVLAGPAAGQDTAALDKLLSDALKDMHNKAADIYNGGDPNGCYHVFKGGLLTARPLLAHRPDVQQLIDQGMQAADQQASVPHRARQLHDTIEAVRTRLKPPARPAEPIAAPASPMPATPMSPAPPPPSASPGPSFPMTPAVTPPPPPVADTLWKRLGGEDGVTKIVEDWLNLAAIDPRVNLTRGDKFKLDKAKEAELKQRFVAYVSSITNGTIVPTATRGMGDVHKGMNITAAEFDAFVGILKTCLEKNNVAARDVDEVVRKVAATKKDVVAGN